MIDSRDQGAGGNGRGFLTGKNRYRIVLVFFVVFLVQSFGSLPTLAADTQAGGRYQVVAGNNDNAYLVNTDTGAVWVLTYRTMATGREPVAIPYKFIGISPKSKGDFIVELAPAMPPNLKDRD